MPVGDIFVEKVKAAQIFHPRCLPRLRKAVSVVHRVTSVATLFAKAHYLRTVYPAWLRQQNADTPVQGPPAFRFDTAFWSRVFSIVKRGVVLQRGAARQQPDPAIQAMVRDYYGIPFFRDDLANRAEYARS